MTAINAVLRRDRAVLMTDAAVYTAQGLVVGFCQKAVALPTLKAAIAVRGVQKITALLAMEMSMTFDTLDQVAAAGSDYFDMTLDRIADDLPEGLEEMQIVVVGWSDQQNRPIGFYYDTTEDSFGMIDDYAFAPAPDDLEWKRLRMQRAEIEHSFRVSEFDPIRHGIPLMEAQRRMKIIPLAADMEDGIPIVGGHILLTEVDRDGVTQRIVHHWSDVAGENIAPAPFSLLPARQSAEPPAPAAPADRSLASINL